MTSWRMGARSRGRVVWGAVLVLLVVLTPGCGRGYSVQTHEQLIDLAWKDSILPLLVKRFPKATEAELTEAHAYAYGGSAIQDIGYYPFGSEFFSDLTHYVRAGDFVSSLLRNARTPQELAFAVGALSHYVGDSLGHAEAVNPSVAIEFPKLERRYGRVVVYDENPHAHVRTEFAFDINEISKHRFAPSAYLEHVGLKVAGDLLDRSVRETYGLTLKELFGKGRGPAIRSYRFAVRRFLPRIAYAENVLHRSGFPPDGGGEEIQQLTRELAKSDFENGWDKYRRHPGIGTYSLAGLIFILPKVGVLSELAIRGPNEQTERMYVRSVNASIGELRGDAEALAGRALELPNRDLDTGALVTPGGYRLTDETYAKLLGRVVGHRERPVPAGLKRNVEAYYADPAAPISTKADAAKWARVQAELLVLDGMPEVAEP